MEHNPKKLDEEPCAMSTSICPIRQRPLTSGRRFRADFSTIRDESPSSPYLQHWLAHRAAQHRNLLLNIDAASRLGLVPNIVGR
jgi:hypothetical protein